MFLKKFILLFFSIFFLNGCAQNAALLAPAYTIASSGNIYHAGMTYGSNEVITRSTGKSTAQNIQSLLTPKKKDTEFEKLVKRRIKETRRKLNFSNQ
jgi:hypothetical protein